MEKKNIAKNLILSVVAQLISTITSLIVGFVIPKFISELQYAYFQTYSLYVGYVGLLHFGLLDGIVLRYSQYDYNQLDKPRIRSQFQAMLAFTAFCGILTSLISALFVGGTYWLIFLLVSIGMVTKNIYSYASYTFQTTNRIVENVFFTVIHRVVYAVFIVVLLLLKVDDFYWYCIADLCSDCAAIIFGICLSRDIYFGRGLQLNECIREVWQNVSSGIFLRIAVFSSSFLIGGAKMVTQWHWDELVFGKVSFAFSVLNVFSNFIMAISVVLFPSLKRMKEEELPSLYKNIRDAISPILVVMLVFYFPLVKILNLWLPKYSQSLIYLGILLPVIIYSSKVSLLTNNYLKAYRKERTMLIINLSCVAAGFIMALFSAYVLNDLNMLLYSVVLIAVISSIISEIVVMKVIAKKRYFDFIAEFIMTIIFIIAVRYFSFWVGFAVYAAALVVYCIVYRRSIVGMIKKVFKRSA